MLEVCFGSARSLAFRLCRRAMDLPDAVVARTISCLARRYVQVCFSITDMIPNASDREHEDQSAVASDEESGDSATREFLFAEDYVVGCLVGLRVRVGALDPSMQLRLIRHRTRAYFSGYVHCLGRVSSLASVSNTWMRAAISKVEGDWCLRLMYLEQVSRANYLPYRVVRDADDEYIARYTGKVCRSLQ